MNRTDFMTEVLKLTGHKRSLHPNVNFGVQRLLDRYEKTLRDGQQRTIVMQLDWQFFKYSKAGSGLKCEYKGIEFMLVGDEESSLLTWTFKGEDYAEPFDRKITVREISEWISVNIFKAS